MKKDLKSTVENNFGLIATFLGFIIDSITLVALVNSKIPPSIPFIDYKLDTTSQLVLWLIAFITYLGFLRERWLRISRKLSTRPENTFSRFLFYDIIVKFKHPFLLIPFVFFVGILIPILSQLSFGGWMLLIVSAVLFFGTISMAVDSEEKEKRSEKEWALLNNPQTYELWINRIEKEMGKNGYVTDLELANLYSLSSSYCNKALWKYHREFETEKDLIYVSEYLEKGHSQSKQYLTLWVVAPRELASSRPWLINEYKYFDL